MCGILKSGHEDFIVSLIRNSSKSRIKNAAILVLSKQWAERILTGERQEILIHLKSHGVIYTPSNSCVEILMSSVMGGDEVSGKLITEVETPQTQIASSPRSSKRNPGSFYNWRLWQESTTHKPRSAFSLNALMLGYQSCEKFFLFNHNGTLWYQLNKISFWTLYCHRLGIFKTRMGFTFSKTHEHPSLFLAFFNKVQNILLLKKFLNLKIVILWECCSLFTYLEVEQRLKLKTNLKQD